MRRPIGFASSRITCITQSLRANRERERCVKFGDAARVYSCRSPVPRQNLWLLDFALLIRQRLKELATQQRDLAAAVQVTESYVSQLLTGKNPPPAPDRTDICGKMETFLRHCVLTDRQNSRDQRNATVPFRTSSPLRIQYSHIADQKNKETCR